MENIKDKIFHACREVPGDLLYPLQILEEMLCAGKIYTRLDLRRNGLDFYNRLYRQKDNEVCCSLHKDNPYIKAEYSQEIDAYTAFIQNNIGLVLNEKVAKQGFKVFGVPLEIRINGSIDLKDNLEAISMPATLTEDLESVKALLTKDKINLGEIFRYKFMTHDLDEYHEEIINLYEDLKLLLKIYKYNVPIINPNTGENMTSVINREIKEAKELKVKTLHKVGLSIK